MASVVVTQTLDWKLHAFDVLSEFDGNNEAAAGPMLVSFYSTPLFCHFLSTINWTSAIELGLVKGGKIGR